jgi:glycosyltransferase involved in cell wall biosynthesis
MIPKQSASTGYKPMGFPPLSQLPQPNPAAQTGWVWAGMAAPLPDIRPDGIPYPSISIITPSYNQAEYLEETIRSVVSQDYPNLEYIIMDGGSTDGSMEIIKKYGPWLSHWQSAKDGGQYDAVQKGFSRSQGEIMAYLNSDDLYFPWTFKVVSEIFHLFPQVDWLTTSSVAVASETSGFALVGQIHNRSRRWFFGNRGKALKSSGFIPQEATFWRRSLWDKAGSRLDTNLKFAGDFELWARFFQHANPVMVNMPLAIFRHHDRQKTKQYELYFDEADLVLQQYPKPVWLPSLLIRILNYVYRRTNINYHWFGSQCDRIVFYPHENSWRYEKNLAS